MCTKSISRWEKLTTTASFLQLLVVAISLIFIGYQLRQQKLELDREVNLSKAANMQSLVALITPLNLRLSEREMAALWSSGPAEIDKLPNQKDRETKKKQYDSMIGSFLDFYENAYLQYRKGLLDADVFKGWDRDLEGFIAERQLAKNWDEYRDYYHKDFSDHVYGIIAAQKDVPPK
jgi:hypothetical protein